MFWGWGPTAIDKPWSQLPPTEAAWCNIAPDIFFYGFVNKNDGDKEESDRSIEQRRKKLPLLSTIPLLKRILSVFFGPSAFLLCVLLSSEFTRELSSTLLAAESRSASIGSLGATTQKNFLKHKVIP